MAIYQRFQTEAENPENPDVISGLRDVISSGMWSGGVGNLTTFHTSSTQSSSNASYYLDVYKENPDADSTAEVQFSIAYIHYHGSGSLGNVGATGKRATAALYGQFSNVLLGPGEDKFVVGNSKTINHAYVIALQRARLREKMDPGNWELHISGSGAGSGKVASISLIDDSGATSNPTVNQGGRVFNVVSGSISGGTATIHKTAATEPNGGYGLFYPDLGIIILNPHALAVSSSTLPIASGSNTDNGNVVKFFKAISGSAKGGKYFSARREEVISSTHYFCRVGNKKFNFSSNPTYFTASDGSFTQPTFFKNPKSYVTQVGLYNDANELLAVAKLSKPLLKSFAREAIVKVKLDF